MRMTEGWGEGGAERATPYSTTSTTTSPTPSASQKRFLLCHWHGMAWHGMVRQMRGDEVCCDVWWWYSLRSQRKRLTFGEMESKDQYHSEISAKYEASYRAGRELQPSLCYKSPSSSTGSWIIQWLGIKWQDSPTGTRLGGGWMLYRQKACDANLGYYCSNRKSYK